MSDWPPGKSEMASLIRAFPWHDTSLGSIQTWPPHLRMAVDLTLSSPVAAVLLWGPERRQIYNEHWREIMGNKHPAGLGQPTHACFPEIMTIMDPLYGRAERGEPVVLRDMLLPIRRRGQVRDAWWTAQFLPVREDSGAVAGLLCIVLETSNSIRAEQEREGAMEALRASEERQWFLLSLADSLRHFGDAPAIKQAACQALGRRLRVCRVGYYDLQEGGCRFEITGDYMEGTSPPLRGAPSDVGRTLLEKLQAEQLITSEDIRTDPRFSEIERNQLVASDVISFAMVVLERNGQRIAGIMVQDRAPRLWSARDTAFLGNVAERIHEAAKSARAEAALRSSEERLRALVTAGSFTLYRMSADWQLMYQLDSATLEPTSGPIADWQQKYILDEDRPLVLGTIQRAMAAKSLFELEHRVRLADGSIGWVLSRAIPLLDASGQILEWFGAGTDVTARKQAEWAQRDSDERFRTLANTVPAMIWAVGAHGENQFVNQYLLDYTGRTADEIAGLNWQTLVHPTQAEAYVESFMEAVRLRVSWHRRNLLRRHDGAWLWFDNHARPLFDASNTYIGHVGVSLNIDASMRAEQAVRISEERLQSAVNIGQVGLWDANLRSGEVYWSDETYRLQGYEVGEVTPSYEAWLARCHVEDRAGIDALRRRAVQERQELVHEYRQQHPDGSIHWLHARIRAYYDESGTAVRMVGAMTDVTARREWEERQEVLIAELQHRTRNLMGVIRSISNRTVRASIDLADFQQRFADRLDALARVQALLSRLNEHDRVSFDELLRSELDAMGTMSERVVLRGPPGIRLRSSTLQTLALALHELATNAVKYGALGQAAGRLAVSWSLHDREGERHWLLVDWRESGVALPPPQDRAGLGQGRDLIDKALPYQLGARTTYAFTQDGVHCTISIPISTHATSAMP